MTDNPNIIKEALEESKIRIDIQELSDSDNPQDASEICSIITLALDRAGYKSSWQNKSWWAGEGRFIGFEITIKDPTQ